MTADIEVGHGSSAARRDGVREEDEAHGGGVDRQGVADVLDRAVDRDERRSVASRCRGRRAAAAPARPRPAPPPARPRAQRSASTMRPGRCSTTGSCSAIRYRRRTSLRRLVGHDGHAVGRAHQLEIADDGDPVGRAGLAQLSDAPDPVDTVGGVGRRDLEGERAPRQARERGEDLVEALARIPAEDAPSSRGRLAAKAEGSPASSAAAAFANCERASSSVRCSSAAAAGIGDGPAARRRREQQRSRRDHDGEDLADAPSCGHVTPDAEDDPPPSYRPSAPSPRASRRREPAPAASRARRREHACTM